jgi:hypothetical protein
VKILLLPEKFDFNEWFIIFSIIAALIWILLLPRRFPHTITTMMVLFSLALEKAADLILEYPPYTFYYLNDKIEYELFDFFVCFLYPAAAYIFIYFYDKWRVRGMYRFVYIMGWSIGAIAFEWITVLAGIFQYQEWKLIYSYPVYIISICLYILFYHFVRSLFANTKAGDIPNNGF